MHHMSLTNGWMLSGYVKNVTGKNIRNINSNGGYVNEQTRVH